jgi:hypothetical protein
MKKIIVGLTFFSSLSTYAEIRTKCVTSEHEVVLITSNTEGKFGIFINRTDGTEVQGKIIQDDSAVHYVSKDLKTLKISFFKNLGLGTAKIDGRLVNIECTNF